MKVTHIAIVAITLLIGAMALLMTRSDRDKEMAKLFEQNRQLMERLDEKRQQTVKESSLKPTEAPAPVSTPGIPEAVAPVAPVAPAVSTPPTKVTAPGAGTLAGNAATGTEPSGELVPPTPVLGVTDPAATSVPALDPSAIPAVAEAGLPPAGDPAVIAKREEELIKENAAMLRKTLADVVPLPDDALSPMGLRIRKLPALCKVTEVQSEHGFVVLDGGTGVGLAAGGQFCIRRDHMIIGKVKISEVKDEKTAVADILANSVTLGVGLRSGDEIVIFNE